MEVQTMTSATETRAPMVHDVSAKGNATTAVDIFRARAAASGSRVAVRRKVAGRWESMTWSEWDTASREIAAGLVSSGVSPGDRVCILAQTRAEWAFADVAIVLAGAVTVPIYPSNTPEQCEYIISDAGAKLVLCDDPSQIEKLFHPEVAAKLRSVRFVSFDDRVRFEKPDGKGRLELSLNEVVSTSERARVGLLADLRTKGREFLAKSPTVLDERAKGLRPSDLFTIVYTSGTTGNPKGVVLTHSNIAFELRALVESGIPTSEADEQLLFLPLAHIFAKLLLWGAIERGGVTTFAEGLTKVADNMREVRPTYVGSVPRIYEKVYAKVVSGAEQAGGLKLKIFRWAIGVGKRVSISRQRREEPSALLALQHALADRLVFSKLQAAFGGRLRFFISGGAPLSKEIAEFFHAAGILILEGYGLTETTAATHINRIDNYRFGTVGLPIVGVETKIAADGEILVRGPNILREYFGKSDATREAIDAEGWFHTGDIGVIEHGGFLRITDRKKDIIVTAGGKNVAPQNIENALKSACPIISQVMVHGDKRPYLVALVTVAEDAVTQWAKDRGLGGSYGELTRNPEIRALIDRAVMELNGRLASYESIKKYLVLDRDFSQDAGELTPTLKVKRKFASEKYAKELASLYA